MKVFFKKFVLVIVATSNYMLLAFSLPQTGNIIILSGTSTSGKTSIAKQLATFFEHPFAYVAFDDFLTEVFLEQITLKLPKKEFHERIHQRISALYDTVKNFAFEGKHVLVDTVLSALEGEKDVQLALEKLQSINVTALVLVYCPLPVLVQRIKQRNEEALVQNRPQDIRLITYIKFHDIFRPQHDENDIALDVLTREDIEVAYATPASASDLVVAELRQMKATALSHFDLIDKESVIITPKLDYDCIVNTGILTPKEAAQQIHDCITSYVLNAFKRNVCRSTSIALY
ncbi:MAG: AAA family ATPase [bacterium]|nr:AAA family ATPase [bacterium]